MAIKREPVTGSNNVISMGHEPGVALEIEFRGGSVYRYTGPKIDEHYANLVKAQSKGGYVARFLRGCKMTKCEKIPSSDVTPTKTS